MWEERWAGSGRLPDDTCDREDSQDSPLSCHRFLGFARPCTSQFGLNSAYVVAVLAVAVINEALSVEPYNGESGFAIVRHIWATGLLS